MNIKATYFTFIDGQKVEVKVFEEYKRDTQKPTRSWFDLLGVRKEYVYGFDEDTQEELAGLTIINDGEIL